jgi:hypothetical protein
MISQLLRAAMVAAALVPLVPMAQSPMTLPLTGTVTDAAGKPIAGVRVTSWPSEDSRTDASGHYTLSKPRDLVRFSLAGYRPVTKTLNSLTAPVVLQVAAERPRALPACSEALKVDKRQADMSLRVNLPRFGKLKAANDADNRVVAMGFHVDWMMHGVGANWSFGLPELKQWKQLVQVEERDITVDDAQVTISDYSGMLQDGSHYRFIGILGESFSYVDATMDSAQYFDRLLDTLCWNATTSTASLRGDSSRP